jgi:hypothetical protein
MPEELTFEIRNICPRIKRGLFTTTNELDIRALCTQDKMMLTVRIPECRKNDKEYIKNALIVEHNKQMKLREARRNSNDIRNGDTI